MDSGRGVRRLRVGGVGGGSCDWVISVRYTYDLGTAEGQKAVVCGQWSVVGGRWSVVGGQLNGG